MNSNTRHIAPARVMVAALLGGLIAAAHADGPPVSIQLNIGAPPPPIYAPAPVYPPAVVAPTPSMVWMPQLGVYIALGLQQPIFYAGGVYYYFYRGGWFAGPGYGGPWRRAEHPPRQLRHFDGRDWGRYQEEARGHAERPHWRQFRPAPQPRWQGEGRGRGEGRGHGERREGHGHDR